MNSRKTTDCQLTFICLQGTRVITASEDDSAPVVLVWDLRNYRTPERVSTLDILAVTAKLLTSMLGPYRPRKGRSFAGLVQGGSRSVVQLR